MPEPLDQIPPPSEEVLVESVLEPDYSVSLEELELRTRLNAVEVLEHELEAKRFMLDMRKRYAKYLFGLCVAWLIFIGCIIWMSGMGGTYCHPFKLSDAVLIALITTTTLNVLGLFLGVTLWLFPRLDSSGKTRPRK